MTYAREGKNNKSKLDRMFRYSNLPPQDSHQKYLWANRLPPYDEVSDTDDDSGTTDARADADLKAKLTVNRSNVAYVRNCMMAQNVLFKETGKYGEWSGSEYHLDQRIRDRLLAHTRQDAAHALLNTITIIDELRSIKRWIQLAFATLVVFIGITHIR